MNVDTLFDGLPATERSEHEITSAHAHVRSCMDMHMSVCVGMHGLCVYGHV